MAKYPLHNPNLTFPTLKIVSNLPQPICDAYISLTCDTEASRIPSFKWKSTHYQYTYRQEKNVRKS